MAYIQGMDRKQTILFPESVDDYIEEDNPVQFMGNLTAKSEIARLF